MAEELTRKQKLKRWVDDHRYELALTSFYGVVGTAFVGLIAVANRNDRKRVEAWNAYAHEMNAWLNDEHNAGNVVYRLDDGRYLTVDANAPQETVIK